jgi:hypothetical protein
MTAATTSSRYAAELVFARDAFEVFAIAFDSVTALTVGFHRQQRDDRIALAAIDERPARLMNNAFLNRKSVAHGFGTLLRGLQTERRTTKTPRFRYEGPPDTYMMASTQAMPSANY